MQLQKNSIGAHLYYPQRKQENISKYVLKGRDKTERNKE